MKDLGNTLIHLGRRVTAYRIIRSFSQEELAHMVDLTSQYIDDLESGMIDCNVLDLIKIASVLEVSVHELFKE